MGSHFLAIRRGKDSRNAKTAKWNCTIWKKLLISWNSFWFSEVNFVNMRGCWWSCGNPDRCSRLHASRANLVMGSGWVRSIDSLSTGPSQASPPWSNLKLPGFPSLRHLWLAADTNFLLHSLSFKKGKELGPQFPLEWNQLIMTKNELLTLSWNMENVFIFKSPQHVGVV